MTTVVESIKPNNLKLCSVEGCQNPKIKLTYCNAHYLRYYRHGDPLKGRHPNRVGCIVEKCKKKHHANGYCKFHNDRKIYGIPFNKPKQIKDSTRICLIFGCNRKYYCQGFCRKHYNTGPNARSWNHNDLFLQVAMNNVRRRDRNKCQWFGCGIQRYIQVHHIFSVSEYPELKYLEEYMICYCRKHHKEWHEKRGDNCSKLIKI